MFHLLSFSPHFIVHTSFHFLQSTVHLIQFIYHGISHSHLPYLVPLIITFHFPQSSLHCSCFISFSSHFIVHISSHFLQSTVHPIHLIYHSLSHSHLTYLAALILYLISFNPHSLFIIHLLSFSPHFIVHVSFLFRSVHSLLHSFHLP